MAGALAPAFSSMLSGYKIHVRLDGRRFSAHFKNGKVVRINERKTLMQFGVPQSYFVSYWNVDHHDAKPGTLPARIIEAAEATLDATP